jgi:branched-subunit amino acid ABC-type transport system permease component
MDLSLLADPVFLIQNLVDGLSRGALYSVYAMGFTLIFGVLDIINLAHGATFMWCAFTGWIVLAGFGLPLPLGLALSMVAGGGGSPSSSNSWPSGPFATRARTGSPR